MIFYFSGTGNSQWVAKQFGAAFGEKLISVADELKKTENLFQYPVAENEKILFVFPVHSWGPAVLIPRFIRKMNLLNYTNQAVYAVCVCGDNCGYTDRIMQKLLAKKSVRLTHTYSVSMPNNYILMKGFGVDTKETEQRKLAAAPRVIAEIVEDIKAKGHNNHYVRGNKPFLKSHIVYPLFKNFAIGKNKFYATSNCSACELCVKICPANTISMKNGKPIWKNTCVQCTACIHRCPTRAVEYGKITQNEGRYVFPNLL